MSHLEDHDHDPLAHVPDYERWERDRVAEDLDIERREAEAEQEAELAAERAEDPDEVPTAIVVEFDKNPEPAVATIGEVLFALETIFEHQRERRTGDGREITFFVWDRAEDFAKVIEKLNGAWAELKHAIEVQAYRDKGNGASNFPF